MKNIAIIPARGGSKRIPRKNIRDFLGKPIIAYSISAAIESQLFDEIMVSTDDREIIDVALQYGAKVPFHRSAKNSDDFATTAEVLIEVLSEYKNNGRNFENACCIQATAPLIQVSNLTEAYKMLDEKKLDSVFPIVRFGYPIQRALSFNEGKTFWMNKENADKRSQDLIPAYHDAGQFYWFNVERFLKTKLLTTENTGAIVLNEIFVQDIDDITDWRICELKYRQING